MTASLYHQYQPVYYNPTTPPTALTLTLTPPTDPRVASVPRPAALKKSGPQIRSPREAARPIRGWVLRCCGVGSGVGSGGFCEVNRDVGVEDLKTTKYRERERDQRPIYIVMIWWVTETSLYCHGHLQCFSSVLSLLAMAGFVNAVQLFALQLRELLLCTG